MDKSTLIADLDALENEEAKHDNPLVQKEEEVTESVGQKPGVISRVFSEEHLVLLLLLLFVSYPGIVKLIDKVSSPLGSLSFVTTALSCVFVYILYKELFI